MEFKHAFDEFMPELVNSLAMPDRGYLVVKGFIDSYQNIYPLSADTKMLSKIIETTV